MVWGGGREEEGVVDGEGGGEVREEGRVEVDVDVRVGWVWLALGEEGYLGLHFGEWDG